MTAGTETLARSRIEGLRIGAFRIPTDAPESDGTLEWTSTTLIVVELTTGGETGLGYTYADTGVALVLSDLKSEIEGHYVAELPALWSRMTDRLRNMGRPGATSMAVSAIDVALWDLKAKQSELSLSELLGRSRETVPVYGSGGFTSYSDAQLQTQFLAWAERGITRFKMKVGRDPSHDRHRVSVARATIPDGAELFVDANSAYSCAQALEFAHAFVDESNVRWLEEPLSPEDFAGLHFLRERVPAQLEIAEGEYGYEADYFRRMMEARAADVVMADVTRCGGITGFMKVAALCEAFHLPLSSHCAPSLHIAPGCAVAPMRHAEYFHDHARIEHELFDGAPEPNEGVLRPDITRPGLGLTFKWTDAESYAI
jgi:L-alanine-DL-glutamate epimerase-like enolase superfamily enzyme